MPARPTLDARYAGVAVLSAASATFSVTIASHPNRVFYALVTTAGTSAPAATAVALDPTGANLALTRIAHVRSTASGFGWADIWQLIAPPVGTWNVTVTAPAGTEHAHGGECWYNVDQTTPVNPAGPHTGSNTAASAATIAITSAIGEMLMGVILDDNNAASGTLADGTGQTRIFFQDAGSGNHQGAGSDKVPTGTSESLTWTGFNSTSDRWAIAAVSLRGASVGLERIARNGGGLVLRNAGGGILTNASDPPASGPTLDSTAAVPVTGSISATVAIAASSSKAVPIGGSIAAAVSNALDSSKPVPIGGSVAGAVAVVFVSSAAVPLSGSIAAAVTVSLVSTKAVPIAGSIAGAVAVLLSSTKAVPIAGAVAGTVLVTLNSSKPVPFGGTIAGTVTAASGSFDTIAAIPISGSIAGTTQSHLDSSQPVTISGLVAGSASIVVASARQLVFGGSITGVVAAPPLGIPKTFTSLAPAIQSQLLTPASHQALLTITSLACSLNPVLKSAFLTPTTRTQSLVPNGAEDTLTPD